MDLMDRQKTIELLEELKTKDPFDRYEKQNIGIDWAIDAVKAASSVLTCEDAVSRQAAIELAMQYCPDDDGSCSKADRDIRELLDDLENLPSAQPEIIACGDCKHWICHDRRCGYWNHGVKPLDWCCHAERRTDSNGKD